MVTGRSPATDGTSLCSDPSVPQRHTGSSWCRAACAHGRGGTAQTQCTRLNHLLPLDRCSPTHRPLLRSAATHLQCVDARPDVVVCLLTQGHQSARVRLHPLMERNLQRRKKQASHTKLQRWCGFASSCVCVFVCVCVCVCVCV